MVKKASKKTQASLDYYKSLIGSTYSYITIIDFERRFDGYNDLRFKVKCICEKEFYPLVDNVLNGKTTSCGCNRYEKVSAAITLPNNQSLINKIYTGYIRHAEEKLLEFKLTKEDISNFIFKNCYYCGSPPLNTDRTKCKNKILKLNVYNGIDRKNNDIGYNLFNCVTCCHICNFAKQSLKIDEFYKWIERLANKNNFKK